MENTNTMKALGAAMLFFCLSCWTNLYAFDVTFSVDMAGYAGTADYLTEGVTLNGTFNGWCGDCNPMSDADGDGIYDVTIDLADGPYEYKFTIGPWTDQEQLIPGTTCTVTNGGFTNRSLDVAGAAVVIGTVCWESCNDCSTAPVTSDVTFSVDMAGYAGTADYLTEGVTLNGDFNGWCGGCAPMDDTDGNGVYELTVLLDEGTYEYKYAIGPWTDQEALTEGDACTITTDGFTNRTIFVAAESTLPTVCWNDCDACAVAPSTYDVTFSVDMAGYAGAEDYLAQGVYLNGTLNGWCGACAPMDDSDGDGIYTLTVALAPGDYEYKYTVGAFVDEENLTEGSTCTITTAGFTNRIVSLVDADVVIGNVCWNECNACGQTPVTYDVTFSVDMDGYAGSADYLTEGVSLNGTFNGWCGNCTQMDDTDGDNVYTITIPLEAGDYEFKYAIGPWTDQEVLLEGSSCTITTAGFTNRALSVATVPVVIPETCWASCETCDVAPTAYDVTFQVDMNEYAGAADYLTEGVTLNGTFNGWCGDCTPMSDMDGDGVYEVTLSLADALYEYKFAIGPWTDQEELTPGTACTITTGAFTNRALTVAGANQTLDAVCWGSCDACGVATAIADVTFSVDMAGYGGTADYLTEGVTLNGTFNGWCGNCTPMDDSDGDGVYTITIPLEAASYEYKFAIGPWTDQEQLTEGDACTLTTDGFTNRTLVVATADPIDQGVVCWATCEACVDAPVNVTFLVDMSGQTVDMNGAHLMGDFNAWDPAGITMSAIAYGVYQVTLPLDANTSFEYKFVNGNTTGGGEIVPAECQQNGNRLVTTSASDATLAVVCFGSCEACSGCTNPLAANFSPFAGSDDGSCAGELLAGCTYIDAENYNANATLDDGSCNFAPAVDACPEDINKDGSVDGGDLLQFLGAFGATCN